MSSPSFFTKSYQFWYAEVPYQYPVFALFVLVGSILQFWPYFAGYHDTKVEQSVMRTNLASIENIVSSTVLITLAVPLAIDGILDFILSLLIDRNKAKETTDILNYIERIYIYSGLLVLPSCAFISQQYVDLAMWTVCCSRFQYFLVYGACFMSVTRIAPHCFPTRLCMLSLGAYFVAEILLIYEYLLFEDYYSFKFDVISETLIYVAFSSIMFMLISWFWFIYVIPCLQQRISSTIIDHSISSVEHTLISDDASSLKNDIKIRNNLFVAVLSVIGVISTSIMLSITTEFPNFSPTNLALVHIAFSVFALGLLIYHLRKFRSDALLRLHALVNKKAILLRYVHELYEPISTIYKAQKYMINELGEVIITTYLSHSFIIPIH